MNTHGKIVPIDPDKAKILYGIREAIAEVELIKQGKYKSIPLNEFLNELKGTATVAPSLPITKWR